MLLGEIGFEKYPIRCKIGVYEHEKIVDQTLYVDLKATIDFTACVESDELKDTIDYTLLASICEKIAQKNSYKLLETLIHDITREILDLHQIKKVWMQIHKESQVDGQKLLSFVEMSCEAK